MKFDYDSLRNIKRPVMLIVYGGNDRKFRDRIRILYPSGKCEWLQVEILDDRFQSSCFYYECIQDYRKNLLNRVIDEMESYDHEMWQTIVEVIQL
jgi:hypothetical protein